MNILVSGASGFIGRAVVRELLSAGHKITALTRVSKKTPGLFGREVTVLDWDAKTLSAWSGQVGAVDAIVNLTGESIANSRWSAAQKEKIIRSRTDATAALVQSISVASRRPKILINASAVGYYGSVPEGEVNESAPSGTGFLAETCRRWEESALKAEAYGVRVVLLRIGVVLGREGGALAKMLLPFKLFVGGALGDGKQWFPWVHRDEISRIVNYCVENERIKGAVNACSPNPVRMSEFAGALGKALHRPAWAPVPALVLKTLLGELSEMILTGQKVVPLKLLQNDYRFRFPVLSDALTSILRS